MELGQSALTLAPANDKMLVYTAETTPNDILALPLTREFTC